MIGEIVVGAQVGAGADGGGAHAGHRILQGHEHGIGM
jgi:hypothetical protein